MRKYLNQLIKIGFSKHYDKMFAANNNPAGSGATSGSNTNAATPSTNQGSTDASSSGDSSSANQQGGGSSTTATEEVSTNDSDANSNAANTPANNSDSNTSSDNDAQGEHNSLTNSNPNQSADPTPKPTTNPGAQLADTPTNTQLPITQNAEVAVSQTPGQQSDGSNTQDAAILASQSRAAREARMRADRTYRESVVAERGASSDLPPALNTAVGLARRAGDRITSVSTTEVQGEDGILNLPPEAFAASSVENVPVYLDGVANSSLAQTLPLRPQSPETIHKYVVLNPFGIQQRQFGASLGETGLNSTTKDGITSSTLDVNNAPSNRFVYLNHLTTYQKMVNHIITKNDIPDLVFIDQKAFIDKQGHGDFIGMIHDDHIAQNVSELTNWLGLESYAEVFNVSTKSITKLYNSLIEDAKLPLIAVLTTGAFGYALNYQTDIKNDGKDRHSRKANLKAEKYFRLASTMSEGQYRNMRTATMGILHSFPFNSETLDDMLNSFAKSKASPDSNIDLFNKAIIGSIVPEFAASQKATGHGSNWDTFYDQDFELTILNTVNKSVNGTKSIKRIIFDDNTDIISPSEAPRSQPLLGKDIIFPSAKAEAIPGTLTSRSKTEYGRKLAVETMLKPSYHVVTRVANKTLKEFSFDSGFQVIKNFIKYYRKQVINYLVSRHMILDNYEFNAVNVEKVGTDDYLFVNAINDAQGFTTANLIKENATEDPANPEITNQTIDGTSSSWSDIYDTDSFLSEYNKNVHLDNMNSIDLRGVNYDKYARQFNVSDFDAMYDNLDVLSADEIPNFYITLFVTVCYLRDRNKQSDDSSMINEFLSTFALHKYDALFFLSTRVEDAREPVFPNYVPFATARYVNEHLKEWLDKLYSNKFSHHVNGESVTLPWEVRRIVKQYPDDIDGSDDNGTYKSKNIFTTSLGLVGNAPTTKIVNKPVILGQQIDDPYLEMDAQFNNAISTKQSNYFITKYVRGKDTLSKTLLNMGDALYYGNGCIGMLADIVSRKIPQSVAETTGITSALATSSLHSTVTMYRNYGMERLNTYITDVPFTSAGPSNKNRIYFGGFCYSFRHTTPNAALNKTRGACSTIYSNKYVADSNVSNDAQGAKINTPFIMASSQLANSNLAKSDFLSDAGRWFVVNNNTRDLGLETVLFMNDLNLPINPFFLQGAKDNDDFGLQPVHKPFVGRLYLARTMEITKLVSVLYESIGLKGVTGKVFHPIRNPKFEFVNGGINVDTQEATGITSRSYDDILQDDFSIS